jgi:hypothetical protein
VSSDVVLRRRRRAVSDTLPRGALGSLLGENRPTNRGHLVVQRHGVEVTREVRLDSRQRLEVTPVSVVNESSARRGVSEGEGEEESDRESEISKLE